MSSMSPWLKVVSYSSNVQGKLLFSYHVKRNLSQGQVLGFKSTMLRLSRIASTAGFKSFDDYFANSNIDCSIEKLKNKTAQDNFINSRTTNASKAATVEEVENDDPSQNELPQTDSPYKMTEELFRAAKQAEPGSAASFWSYRLYRGPDDKGAQTRSPVVHYCRSSSSTEKVLASYFKEQTVIGFDIEWKADALRFHGPRANVSLIQIASSDRIGLFHVALYPRGDILVPPSLKKIMEDPKISKVGVSIKSDCTRIKRHLNVECQGLFELSHLFKLVKYSQTKDFDSINRKLVSLAKQVQEHLHLPLFKGGDVRLADWSQKLQLHQIVYAAADSYAALQLYHTLEFKRKALVPSPPRPSHAELNAPIRFTETTELADALEVDEVELESEK